MDSSISEAEFQHVNLYFHKFSVLENSRKVFYKSLKSPWILHKLACMNPVYMIFFFRWLNQSSDMIQET